MAACFTACANGSGPARLLEPLYESFFVGGRAGAQRAGRQAVGPAVFPAPAFHCAERASTHVAPAAAGKPSTNTRPKEMPMKQRDPE